MDKTDKFTIYSAIFSLNYVKGFSVLRTFNIDETAIFICNCAYKLKKCIHDGKKSFYCLSNNNSLKENDKEEKEETEKNYVNVVKKVKKENINPQNIDEIMLCQIPGISSVTAIAVIEEFKSIYNLTKQLEENGIKCLEKISYKTTKNQSRKINKTCISNIEKFLLKKI
jgi:ERCC4-type nuclease